MRCEAMCAFSGCWCFFCNVFERMDCWYLPGLPRKTEEYKTPLRAASVAARASGGDDHSRLGHHLPMEQSEKNKRCNIKL